MSLFAESIKKIHIENLMSYLFYGTESLEHILQEEEKRLDSSYLEIHSALDQFYGKDTKEEEVEIINPDVALLKEMHQTATKLNDLILKTALMVAKKGEATDDVEDSRENLNDQSDENTESKDNQDKTNQETINDDMEDANNRIIIEELKD